MSKLPEEIAADTVEACAAWIDERAREAATLGDADEQGWLEALAEAMRFDQTPIVAKATGLIP